IVMDDIEVLQVLGKGGYATCVAHEYGNANALFTDVDWLPGDGMIVCFCVGRKARSSCTVSDLESSSIRIVSLFIGMLALKRIPRNKVVSDLQQQRVRTEQRVLSEVTSAFLCRSVDHFEDEDFSSLLLEYIDGKPLYRCVWHYKDRGRFPEHIAKFYAAQVVLAIRALHTQGFVHRDLKSGNILVDKRGFAKVIDFGLAKELSKADPKDPASRTSSFCGTHYIMAPEVFLRTEYGFQVDWWGLGVIIYEMVCGRPPWEYQSKSATSLEAYFDSISNFAKNISTSLLLPDSASPELKSLLQQLLAFNPGKRLGLHGANEIMQHPWFHDTPWESLQLMESGCASDIVPPYNLATDDTEDTATSRNALDDMSSSAESIDPEDNAKYFADF
ncbi:TPA: hypothetical protein N0F65_010750, partial [Lagenidium giganteum]